MKHLKPFKLIQESFSINDLDEILQDLKDYGMSIEVKEGWIPSDKVESEDPFWRYDYKVAYAGSVKAYFILLQIYELEPDILVNIIEDTQTAKERLESFGKIDIDYSIETNKKSKNIELYCGIRVLMSNQVHSSDTMGEFKQLLIKNGYNVIDCPIEGWKYCLRIVLPKIKVPKLDRPFSKFSRAEKRERIKFVENLKRELWQENRKKIEGIIESLAIKHHLDYNFYHRNAYEIMDIAFRARYNDND